MNNRPDPFLVAFGGKTVIFFRRLLSPILPLCAASICNYMLIDGWSCQFLEMDFKTSLPCTFTFGSEDKVRGLAERGGAFTDLASKQAFEHGITMGRGGVTLTLTPEQYVKLKR